MTKVIVLGNSSIYQEGSNETEEKKNRFWSIYLLMLLWLYPLSDFHSISISVGWIQEPKKWKKSIL